MMENNFVLSATLELRDKMTAGIKSARSSLTGLEQGMKGAQNASDGAVGAVNKAGSAMGAMAAKADAAKRSLEGIKGTHNVTIRANDNATSTVQRVKTELSELTGKLYTATVNVKTNKSGAKLPSSAIAAANTEGIGSKLMNGASGMAGGMLMNTSMQMAGAAGIGFGIYDAIKGYMDFEKEMSAVKAISGASEEDFQKLTDKAIQMGADTKFSAFESAQALEYMGMAGWKADEMMDGLPGIMNLAAASGENLASVSDIVTDSMSAFKLQASDAAMFSDVLAAAATNSNTNVGKLGYSFKYVAPVAGALGYTIQDVSIALGTMADAGIKAEQAGTSMRELLTRMAKPTKESADAMAELGLSFTDATGKVIPLRDQMNNMRSAFAGKSRADQARLAAMLAGQEGMSGLLAIVNQSQDKFDKLTDAIDNSQGAAERMSKTRLDNLAGDLEYLSGDWDTFTMNLMKGDTAGGLRSFVKEADSLLTHFADSVKAGGLGVKAFATTAGMALRDLKNEFLEFDGIGSVLAGGALVAGMYKITKLSKRAVEGVRGMFPSAGGKDGIHAGAGSSVVGEMVVNAATVIVNGAGGLGGGKNTPIQDIFLKAQQQAREKPPTGFWGEVKAGIREIPGMAKSNVKGNVAMAAVAAAMDIAFSDNRQKAVAESIGMVGGTAAGTAVGTAVGGAIGSIVPIIGTSIGGMIGGMLGGMAGGYVGEQGGESAAEKFHLGQQTEKTNPDFVDHIMEQSRKPETQDYDLTKGINPVLMPKKDEDWSTRYDLKKTLRQNAHQDAYRPTEELGASSSDYFADYQQSITNQRETGQMPGTPSYAFQFPLPGSGGGSPSGSGDVSPTGSGSANDAVDYTNMGISDDSVAQMQARVDELKENLSSKWQEISQDATTAFGNAQTNIGGILGTLEADASQHFSSLREAAGQKLDELSTNAGDACNDIGQYFENASERAQGAWEGVRGFFGGLWADLKEGAASAARSIASSLAQAAANAESGGHSTISSIYRWGANQLSYLGGGPGFWSGTTSFVPAYADGGVASFAAANVAHGLAQINEHGGELVDLPTGSRIYPAATTEHIIQREVEKSGIIPALPDFGQQDPAPTSSPSVTLSLSGNTFVVREEADMDKIVYKIMQEIKNAACNHNSMEIGGAY
jgi:TP901 family phage tail tape measure protein